MCLVAGEAAQIELNKYGQMIDKQFVSICLMLQLDAQFAFTLTS